MEILGRRTKRKKKYLKIFQFEEENILYLAIVRVIDKGMCFWYRQGQSAAPNDIYMYRLKSTGCIGYKFIGYKM